jgi:hypothetical protein
MQLVPPCVYISTDVTQIDRRNTLSLSLSHTHAHTHTHSLTHTHTHKPRILCRALVLTAMFSLRCVSVADYPCWYYWFYYWFYCWVYYWVLLALRSCGYPHLFAEALSEKGQRQFNTLIKEALCTIYNTYKYIILYIMYYYYVLPILGQCQCTTETIYYWALLVLQSCGFPHLSGSTVRESPAALLSTSLDVPEDTCTHRARKKN